VSATYRRVCLETKGEKCEICGTTKEIVVHHVDGDRENPQRITESFAAEQGDQIRVNIANTAMGYRTHVAIESPSGETVLSEGV